MIMRSYECFGVFRDLDYPFTSDHNRHLSPLHGLEQNIIKNIRLYGEYGVGDGWDPELLEPNVRMNLSLNLAQNATLALIRLLFPSSVGLVANAGLKDRVNDALNPASIARLLILNDRHRFFTQKENITLLIPQLNEHGKFKTEIVNGKEKLVLIEIIEEKQIIDIFEALMRDNSPLKKKWSACKENKFIFLLAKDMANEYDYNLKLARLLFRVFTECRDGQALTRGYPRHIVHRVLLCYMWEKNKHNKANFKAYYNVLANDENKKIDSEAVSRIKWSGNGSHYSQDDYQNCLTNKNNSETMTPFEKFHLIKQGYSAFDARFPKAIEYGLSLRGTNTYFSDCGDSMLRNFFMMMLYNHETQSFDVTKLKHLQNQYGVEYKPLANLIDYFSKKCTKPSQADTAEARNAWVDVVSNLNNYRCNDDETEPTVKYLANDNTQYEIAPGLDNAISVIFKILGSSLFTCHMGNNNKKVYWLGHLDAICEFFSNKSHANCDENTWHAQLSTTNRKHDMDESPEFNGDIPENGWVNLVVTFSYGNTKDGRHNIFECHFEQNHFGFVECNKHVAVDNLVIPESNNPDVILNMRMNTCQEKIAVIDKILSIRPIASQQSYQWILDHWLEINGRYFANWRNIKINTALARVLLKHLCVDEILAFAITELNYALVLPLAEMGRNDDIRKVLDNDLQENDFYCFVAGDDNIKHANQHRFSTAAGALETALLKGKNNDLIILKQSGANDYSLQRSGLTLLHLAAYAGNKRLSTSYSQLGSDINAKTSHGDTPLHFAARSGRSQTIQTLLAAGANANAVNNKGETAFALASITNIKKMGLFSYFIGCSRSLNFIKSPYSEKYIDDSTLRKLII